MGYYKLIFFVLLFSYVQLEDLEDEPCPGTVQCLAPESMDSCPEGSFYRENVFVHGCCPGCVKGLAGFNETCDIDSDCEPGYSCQNGTLGYRCKEDKTNQPCAVAYLNLDNPVSYVPSCSPDGFYAPKQCKGETLSGRCFCVDKLNRRIFGELDDPSKSENMTCACSRQVLEMGLTSIHCNSMGNFETLQCDKGVCWCANEYTGDPYSLVVAEKMIDLLPCYDADKVGLQYLRQCDSQYIQQEYARKLMKDHGSTNIYFPMIRCNPDGSYDRWQIINNKKACTYKDGTQLNEGVSTDVTDIDCNCLYDQYVYQLNGKRFSMACETNGNYVPLQSVEGQYYCVDNDGFSTTIVSPTKPTNCKRQTQTVPL